MTSLYMTSSCILVLICCALTHIRFHNIDSNNKHYMKMMLKSSFFIIVSFISFIFVFYSAGKLMYFLSVPTKFIPHRQPESTVLSLLSNMILLTIFMVQHTFMVLPAFKNYLQKLDLHVIYRSIYNLLTACSILALIHFWRTTTEFLIWNIDTNISTSWFAFTAIHLFAWSIIYTGCLFMDMSEILGVKQVYYSLRNMPNPMDFKSSELQRLYSHTRHPSFSAFTIIFWANPAMTLDRFLLALVLTGYMYIAWKTDKYDLYYQKNQYVKKSQELNRLH